MTDGKPECPSTKELADFINGRVPLGRLSSLETHIESCDTCAAALADLPADRLVQRLSKFDYVEGKKGPRTSNDPFELGENARYKIITELGEGGMGQVFKARHKVMKRTVALKTIRPELINHPEAVRRFAKEARAAARLSHPNIVTAYDAEQVGDMHMLVMEYVEGESFSALVNRGGVLDAEKAIDFICQAAEGLQHAHERKMVHRDIKPQNLMVTPKNVVKILDFGLSKFRRDLEAGETDSVADETILTLHNTSLGTEGFIAPEQAADARSVDIRSDIYSLGCTLFYLLTNRPPYFGAPPDDESAVPDVCRFRQDLPSGLPELLQRMMAPKPEDRFDTPRDVVVALQAIDLDDKRSPGEQAASQGNGSSDGNQSKDAIHLNSSDKTAATAPSLFWPILIGVLILGFAIYILLK